MSTKRGAPFTTLSYSSREAAKMLLSAEKTAADSPGIHPAAHEVNDLQTIAIAELGFSPLRARHDFAIEFDRHAISLHPKLLDELR